VFTLILDTTEVEAMLERGRLLRIGHEHSRDELVLALEAQIRILCRLD
jgi:hypothetical protein